MKTNIIALLIASILLPLASCNTQKTPLPYFTDLSSISQGALETMDYQPVIKPDDELSITVNTLNPQATAIYQMPFVNPARTSELSKSSSPKVQTYLVDADGNIDFPVIGKMHVAGITTSQLASLLTDEISKEVKDPIVDVRILNFTITVGGEVRNPSQIPVSRERMTVLDALAAAGDLTEFGERSNVLIVREKDGKREYAHLDLNKAETLNSPYYYVEQNDYIYVSPNQIRQANSRYNSNNAYKLSVISTIVSASSVIASLIIALTIK